MKYAYCRVSTKDQNLDRQIADIKKAYPDISDENIYLEKQSGKDFNRTVYVELKSKLQPGDELIISEFDRLGRNKEEMKIELQEFKTRQIIVRILDIPTTLIDYQGQEWIFDMINNVIIEVLASVAEQERTKIRRRQREGIDVMPMKDGKRISSKTGRPIGRPNKELPDFEKFFKKQKDGLLNVSEACRELGISRTQWYRMIG